MKLQERSIGHILLHSKQVWLAINNYSTKTSSGRRLTLVNLKLHCIQSASFFMLSTVNKGSSNKSFPNSSWVDWGIDWKGTSRTEGPFDPSAPLLPDPLALDAPLAVAGAWSGALGLGSLGFSAVSTLGKLAAGVLINPITGDSRADRLVPYEPLDTQLRMSWTWFFSCAGRCWTLAEQDSE